MEQLGDQPHRESEGNRYLLLADLEPPPRPMTLAPGLTLLSAPAVGGDLPDVHFENGHFTDVMSFMDATFCEIESAVDSTVSPGRDTERRAILASQLLTLLNFSSQFPVAVAQRSWGCIERDRRIHDQRLRERMRSRRKESVAGGQEANVDDLADLREESEALGPFRAARILMRARPHFVGSPREGTVTEADAEELRDTFSAFNAIAGANRAFRFALSAADDWRWAVDERAAIARLWSGIEAIAGAKGETTFRTAAQVACLIEQRGDQRFACFKNVKKLYKIRSDAVHGNELKGSLKEGLKGSFDVLRRLLLAVVRRGTVPSEGEYEKLLFE
jgi:hypothetical protein